MSEEIKKEMEQPAAKPQAAKMSEEECENFYKDIYDEFGPKKPKAETQKKVPAEDLPILDDEELAGKKGKKEKKQMSNRALQILVCMECLGITAVVLWWVLRLL